MGLKEQQMRDLMKKKSTVFRKKQLETRLRGNGATPKGYI